MSIQQDMGKKNICIGLLAHVDAGKTTLSEQLLYESGMIRKTGRVDDGDAFLDTHRLEKMRGITIFSHQAVIRHETGTILLMDTPGHVDFAAEMERALSVLDYAVLIISAADGVQAHTRTIWKLLAEYGIPVFVFINKMDQPGTDRDSILRELQEELDGGCMDFSQPHSDAFCEEVCMHAEEALLETYLEKGTEAVTREVLGDLVAERRIFPCFFGAALHARGTRELLDALLCYTKEPAYPDAFGAKVFKVTTDPQGNTLAWMKITGGTLRPRDVLLDRTHEHEIAKIQQLRLYSGEKFELLQEARAGTVVAVTGFETARPGQGIGAQEDSAPPQMEPVLNYDVIFPEGTDPFPLLSRFRRLEAEVPELHVLWDEEHKKILLSLMGEVQKEVLQEIVKERLGVEVSFSAGHVSYRETIETPSVGIGHFEPLRHYAEVHLLLEPAKRGSGLSFAAACENDTLDTNWQRLILTHLAEKDHRGVLTGAPVTDMKITLIAGRAHLKHTEGGDFRQATYRAVRQGLMRAKSVLLEPVYAFEIRLPEQTLGRAMSDIDRMHGTFDAPQQNGGTAVLTGKVPVASFRDYPTELASYTRGEARLQLTVLGYEPCHNAQEVIDETGYDPLTDAVNPVGSIFCSHGAGYPVSWDEMESAAHLKAESVSQALKQAGEKQ